MNVIQLTRLRHGETFYINPDLLERVDTHVDTVIRLTTGAEYVVSESGDEIVRRVADFRARTIALAGIFQEAATAAADVHATRADTNDPRAATPLGALATSLSDIPSGIRNDSHEASPEHDTAPPDSATQHDVAAHHDFSNDFPAETPTDSMDHRDGPVTSSQVHVGDPS